MISYTHSWHSPKLYITGDIGNFNNLCIHQEHAEKLIHYGLMHLQKGCPEGNGILPKHLRGEEPIKIHTYLLDHHYERVDPNKVTWKPRPRNHYYRDFEIWMEEAYRKRAFVLTPVGTRVLQEIHDFLLNKTTTFGGLCPWYSLGDEKIPQARLDQLLGALDHVGLTSKIVNNSLKSDFFSGPHLVVLGVKSTTYWCRRLDLVEALLSRVLDEWEKA